MKLLQQIRELARGMAASLGTLLALIDDGEEERRELVESAKKTPSGM